MKISQINKKLYPFKLLSFKSKTVFSFDTIASIVFPPSWVQHDRRSLEIIYWFWNPTYTNYLKNMSHIEKKRK